MRRKIMPPMAGQMSLFEIILTIPTTPKLLQENPVLIQSKSLLTTSMVQKPGSKKNAADKLNKLIDRISKKESSTSKKQISKESSEHIIPIVHGVPKEVKIKTEKYVNAPYSMTLTDAFRKAAGEYKKPSKKLCHALEKDNFKDYIPSEYEEKQKKLVKRCLTDYNFQRYVGQKVRLGDIRGKEYTIASFDHYFTFFEGCHGPYDNDDTLSKIFGTPHGKNRIIPADLKEYIESLKVELEYNTYELDRANKAGNRNNINCCKANIKSLEKAISDLQKGKQ